MASAHFNFRQQVPLNQRMVSAQRRPPAPAPQQPYFPYQREASPIRHQQFQFQSFIDRIMSPNPRAEPYLQSSNILPDRYPPQYPPPFINLYQQRQSQPQQQRQPNFQSNVYQPTIPIQPQPKQQTQPLNQNHHQPQPQPHQSQTLSQLPPQQPHPQPYQQQSPPQQQQQQQQQQVPHFLFKAPQNFFQPQPTPLNQSNNQVSPYQPQPQLKLEDVKMIKHPEYQPFQVPIDRTKMQPFDMDKKQSYLTYEVRYGDGNGMPDSHLSRIQDPDATEFIQSGQTIVIVHNQREYEQQIDFDRLPPDWKVIDLIRMILKNTQLKFQRAAMYVMTGRANKLLLSPQLSLQQVKQSYDSNTLCIEELM